MLVRFSALQMYDLVNDVESYHAFLPGCVGGKVLEFDGQTMARLSTCMACGNLLS